MLYWGVGLEGWDFDERGKSPKRCTTCDGIYDTWRGRFDNAQITLRMCAAEGRGFKRYIDKFLMYSSKLSVLFDLKTFYDFLRWQNKKVLDERMVIGTVIDLVTGKIKMSPNTNGIDLSTFNESWKEGLQSVAHGMSNSANKVGGRFAVLILDEKGMKLDVSEMVRYTQLSHVDRISQLLIVLGGPEGIPDVIEKQMLDILDSEVTIEMFRCALLGGKMHSYYALSTLFVMHDQGIIMPFLDTIADDVQTNNNNIMSSLNTSSSSSTQPHVSRLRPTLQQSLTVASALSFNFRAGEVAGDRPVGATTTNAT